MKEIMFFLFQIQLNISNKFSYMIQTRNIINKFASDDMFKSKAYSIFGCP